MSRSSLCFVRLLSASVPMECTSTRIHKCQPLLRFLSIRGRVYPTLAAQFTRIVSAAAKVIISCSSNRAMIGRR